MRTTVLRATAALGATAAVLTGCSLGPGSTSTTTSGATPSVTADGGLTGTVEVISQTNMLLVSAQETLEARGLVVEAVDITGEGRVVDDPTEWVVVTQDPETGTVEAGATVVVEVRRTDDPRS